MRASGFNSGVLFNVRRNSNRTKLDSASGGRPQSRGGKNQEVKGSRAVGSVKTAAKANKGKTEDVGELDTSTEKKVATKGPVKMGNIDPYLWPASLVDMYSKVKPLPTFVLTLLDIAGRESLMSVKVCDVQGARDGSAFVVS